MVVNGDDDDDDDDDDDEDNDVALIVLYMCGYMISVYSVLVIHLS